VPEPPQSNTGVIIHSLKFVKRCSAFVLLLS
jgi:hypothetical protein